MKSVSGETICCRRQTGRRFIAAGLVCHTTAGNDMTFEQFQQHCTEAMSTNQTVTLPCPVIVGEGPDRAAIGDTHDHHLVIFRTEA